MKKHFSLIVLLLLSFTSCGQNSTKLNSEKDELKNVAKDIMKKAGTCALISLDEEGRPRVRAMDPFLPEEDLTVWFGTNANSRKVTQIKNDNKVTLYYIDKEATEYVMVHGIAEIIDDSELKEKYWKDTWKNFYPDYPKGYLLIKVSPEWMEVISEGRGILGDTITWEPPIVKFESKN